MAVGRVTPPERCGKHSFHRSSFPKAGKYIKSRCRFSSILVIIFYNSFRASNADIFALSLNLSQQCLLILNVVIGRTTQMMSRAQVCEALGWENGNREEMGGRALGWGTFEFMVGNVDT